ncbi:LysR family transcriptional regulator|uniref:DNA-binding transcriptional regulator, LysR family n=1 Tax=Dendrosporobacter quercicolus TaxID=146817 RepID=A0A1G9RN36_9FIRM|nr:LysR substrate-binding domain-containing protein [Dendrosporobacter quercicolus]NSL49397.1 LysR family transcriptional regulator [Dendrosporobacter quercicolus DSM 1736]SDM24688.1 DNA-binding transcriptional regulator, LysR family [Dendrosporobacter quercicolus]
MEIRQLQYFQMACQLKSITKAAERLHVSQPSVSMAIQKLEEELGVLLLDRRQKQITLTGEGEVFLQRIRDVLSRLQDIAVEMNDYKRLQKGTIRIGIPPMIGTFLFPHIYAEFGKRYPLVEIVATEAGTMTIREQLEQDVLDLGIILLSQLSPNLETAPLAENQILVCLPPGHPLAELEHIPFTALAREPFILFHEDSYNRHIILEECRRHRFQPHIRFSSNQIGTITGLVEQGMGISFLLDAVVSRYANICSRPLANPLFFKIVMAWKSNRYLSKPAKAFMDFITELYR